MTDKANQLANETSPYLLQHAHNPVNWFPWNQTALNKAHQENKPILLSIGYAACHWCHVMAHESFEDEETAKLMNKLFISIKVDREERPDLDKVYQSAHFLLTQRSGGWPLTIFLTPDLTPFFSGTYFPREPRYQLPSFKEVLKAIANIYKQHPEEVKKQNQKLLNILSNQKPPEDIQTFTSEPMENLIQTLKTKFDYHNGGLSGAPKFPHPTLIEWLLAEKSSSMAKTTLLHMAEGGIYDQIQGGFFRYSVDEKWEIPHFEKMLYDNAQLLFLYSVAYQQFNDPFFATIAKETADWIITKMQSPNGGYYSSLDADSEGHEGKFYVWKKSEIETLLSTEEMKFALIYFGLSSTPNFENEYHLHIIKSVEAVAKDLNISMEKAQELLFAVKKKLLIAREKRISPAQDQKILTAWNSLMIKGMAIAGDVLQEKKYLASAQRALECIRKHLWVNNRLLVSFKDDKATLPAYLDDYAFLLDALITLLQIAWDTKYLEFAIQLSDNLLEHFYDKTSGGFFFTANDHEKILYRPKTMMDEAMPAGNAVVARAMITLGHLLGEQRYLDAAENTLKLAWAELLPYPIEHCSLLFVLKNFLTPRNSIVIRGEENDLQIWRNFCKNQDYINNNVFAIPAHVTDLPGLLASRIPQQTACAYFCQGTQCLPIINNFATLKKLTLS